jgi:hypothetical protein
MPRPGWLVLTIIAVAYTLIQVDTAGSSDLNVVQMYVAYTSQVLALALTGKVNSLPATVSSSMFCRVVLNLHQVKHRQVSDVIKGESELDIQFTTWFNSSCYEAQGSMQQNTSVHRRLPSRTSRSE